MASALQNDLFSSLISEIKTYTGKDPLLPWLQGIRKMKESLSPQLLKEKLPRFLQKCAQTFETDRRYRNDLRYLRVWIQLMDFVGDPRPLLKTMEMNRIGTRRTLFYQAYALYYEKLKRFEEAEKMYHLGVQSLAEPADELQKSYEKFLRRMELYKKKKTMCQKGKAAIRPFTSRNIPCHLREIEETKEYTFGVVGRLNAVCSEISSSEVHNNPKNVKTDKVVEESSTNMMRGKLDTATHLNHLGVLRNSCDVGMANDPSISEDVMGNMESEKPSTFCNDDTVVVKFVDTAIVGKSDTEDACHHGLVDPTINMKEAMNAINNMFREPLELEPVLRIRSHRSQNKVDLGLSNGFEVFVDVVDENLDRTVGLSNQKEKNGNLLTSSGFLHPADPILLKKQSRTETQKPLQESFKIFVDDKENNEGGYSNEGDDNLAYGECEFQHSTESSTSSSPRVNAFVFPGLKDLAPNSFEDPEVQSSYNSKLREDTVVCRFVGSAILDEPEVENACHHGLVDPTINLKEAMEDINSMFGKPLDFVKTNRHKKQYKLPDRKRECSGFSILPDEDLKDRQEQASLRSSSKLGSESDLFEPTVFTKEAMAEINDMFNMPLDF